MANSGPLSGTSWMPVPTAVDDRVAPAVSRRVPFLMAAVSYTVRGDRSSLATSYPERFGNRSGDCTKQRRAVNNNCIGGRGGAEHETYRSHGGAASGNQSGRRSRRVGQLQFCLELLTILLRADVAHEFVPLLGVVGSKPQLPAFQWLRLHVRVAVDVRLRGVREPVEKSRLGAGRLLGGHCLQLLTLPAALLAGGEETRKDKEPERQKDRETERQRGRY